MGQLYQALSLSELEDTSAELLVEAVFCDFTDPERALFPREISIDPVDKDESLTIRLVVAADPDDGEAVTIHPGRDAQVLKPPTASAANSSAG